jgi:adenylate kinase family enzyme
MQCLLNDYIAENPGADETMEIKRCFADGTRVRDDLVNALFGVRIRRHDTRELGACIDGFPKTEGQVNFMKNTLRIEPNYVFVLECSEESLAERNRIFDVKTSKKYSIEEARQTGDYALTHRITQAIEDSAQAFKNRVDSWETTKRDIFKGFEGKIVTIHIEKQTEQQIVEKIEFIVRKMRL